MKHAVTAPKVNVGGRLQFCSSLKKEPCVPGVAYCCMPFLDVWTIQDCQAAELDKVQLHGHQDFPWGISFTDIFILSGLKEVLNSFIDVCYLLAN